MRIIMVLLASVSIAFASNSLSQSIPDSLKSKIPDSVLTRIKESEGKHLMKADTAQLKSYEQTRVKTQAEFNRLPDSTKTKVIKSRLERNERFKKALEVRMFKFKE